MPGSMGTLRTCKRFQREGRDHGSDAGQRPGATIYSVAALAGVSIASVSRVLQGSTAVSDRTRVKVLAAAEQLELRAAGRRPQPRGPPPRGARPRPARAHRPLLLRAADGLRVPGGRARAERGPACSAGGKADLTRAVRQLAARVDGLAMLGSAAIPESAVRALQGSKPLAAHRGRPPRGRRGHQRGEHRERPRADDAPARPRPARGCCSSATPAPARTSATATSASRRPTRAGSARQRPSRCASRSARPTAPGSRSASSRATSTPTRWCAPTTSSPCRSWRGCRTAAGTSPGTSPSSAGTT